MQQLHILAGQTFFTMQQPTASPVITCLQDLTKQRRCLAGGLALSKVQVSALHHQHQHWAVKREAKEVVVAQAPTFHPAQQVCGRPITLQLR